MAGKSSAVSSTKTHARPLTDDTGTSKITLSTMSSFSSSGSGKESEASDREENIR